MFNFREIFADTIFSSHNFSTENHNDIEDSDDNEETCSVVSSIFSRQSTSSSFFLNSISHRRQEVVDGRVWDADNRYAVYKRSNS